MLIGCQNNDIFFSKPQGGTISDDDFSWGPYYDDNAIKGAAMWTDVKSEPKLTAQGKVGSGSESG